MSGKGYFTANIKWESVNLERFLSQDEFILQVYALWRYEIVLTNYGVYTIELQGITGKKQEIRFYPKKSIKGVSFESKGHFDIDVDIKIYVDGNTQFKEDKYAYNEPIEISVFGTKEQVKEAENIIKYVKLYYLT